MAVEGHAAVQRPVDLAGEADQRAVLRPGEILRREPVQADRDRAGIVARAARQGCAPAAFLPGACRRSGRNSGSRHPTSRARRHASGGSCRCRYGRGRRSRCSEGTRGRRGGRACGRASGFSVRGNEKGRRNVRRPHFSTVVNIPQNASRVKKKLSFIEFFWNLHGCLSSNLSPPVISTGVPSGAKRRNLPAQTRRRA